MDRIAAIDAVHQHPVEISLVDQGFGQVSPVKGVEGFNRSSPVSGPTFVDATEGGKRLRRGARLWTVAVSTFRAETYRFLRLARPTEEEMADGAVFPPGSVHLPHWIENEWLAATGYPPLAGDEGETDGETLQSIATRFRAHKEEVGDAPKTIADFDVTMRLAYEIIPAERPVRAINDADVRGIRDLLKRIPH